jgi:hypothetical protein
MMFRDWRDMAHESGWQSPDELKAVGWKSGDEFDRRLNDVIAEAGKIKDKRVDQAIAAERARIVGLFDAEEEQISEQDWTNNSMKRLDAHQRIIEGLREKK